MYTQKEYATLIEAYNAVYENQEVLEEKKIATETGKKVMPSAKERSALAKRARAGEDIGKKGKGFEKVAAKAAKQYGSKEAGERVAAAAMFKAQAKEEVETDLFDVILEHLVAEGYADTNKAALAIMANMSEEWKQSIVEAGMNPSETPAAKQQMTKAAVDFFTKPRKPLSPYEARTPRFPAVTVPDFGLGTSKPSVKIPKFGRDDGRTEKPKPPVAEKPKAKPPVTKAKPPVTPAPPKAETPKTETPKPTEAPKVETPKPKGGEVAMSKIGDKSDYSVAATAKMSDRTKTILGTKDSETGKTIRKPQFGSLSPRERRGLG